MEALALSTYEGDMVIFAITTLLTLGWCLLSTTLDWFINQLEDRAFIAKMNFFASLIFGGLTSFSTFWFRLRYYDKEGNICESPKV